MSYYQLPLVGYIQNVSLTLHLFIVSIRFKAIGSVPILNKDVYKIKTNQRFENVVKFLRDNLGIPASESIFTYINATFAPALDENVGNLYNVSK